MMKRIETHSWKKFHTLQLRVYENEQLFYDEHFNAVIFGEIRSNMNKNQMALVHFRTSIEMFALSSTHNITLSLFIVTYLISFEHNHIYSIINNIIIVKISLYCFTHHIFHQSYTMHRRKNFNKK